MRTVWITPEENERLLKLALLRERRVFKLLDFLKKLAEWCLVAMVVLTVLIFAISFVMAILTLILP